MTHWTELKESPLWIAAVAAHAAPAGRHYHNMSHVRRLYLHAAITFDFPYCPDLDRAILAHDAIVDGKPGAERRSVAWLTSCLRNPDLDLPKGWT